MASNQQPINLTTSEYIENSYKQLSAAHPDVNKFALPKIDKVVLNVGVGRYDEKQKSDIANLMQKLTSHVPRKIAARVSIASFKLRAGQTVGLSLTLRGQKAIDFIMQLVYVALPRTRDFKGIKGTAFDNNFNCYSMGLENVSIFPAIGFDTNVQFGMQVNVVFKQPTPLNKEFLQILNFPFKKTELEIK